MTSSKKLRSVFPPTMTHSLRNSASLLSHSIPITTIFVVATASLHTICIEAAPAPTDAFHSNIVKGGVSTAAGAYNYWAVSSDCMIVDNQFSVISSVGSILRDCYMTQTIDITFARKYLLNPGGKVMISMQGYIMGYSGDYATLNLTLLECISGNPKHTLGGNRLNSSTWITYTWGMRLPPNMCSARLQLYLRNHFLNSVAPKVQTITVFVTGTPATRSPTLSVTTTSDQPTHSSATGLSSSSGSTSFTQHVTRSISPSFLSATTTGNDSTRTLGTSSESVTRRTLTKSINITSQSISSTLISTSLILRRTNSPYVSSISSTPVQHSGSLTPDPSSPTKDHSASLDAMESLLPQQLLVTVVVLRSQLVSAVAGIGAASGGARLASITVAQCGTGDGGVSGLLPLSVAVSPSCHFTSPHLDDINAIVGNWVVVLVGTAAAGIACAMLCLFVGFSCVDAMRLLTFPMCVLPLWVAAAPSAAAAAIHLATTFSASDDEACSSSVAVVVVTSGLLLVIVPLPSVVVAVWFIHSHFAQVDTYVAFHLNSRAPPLMMRLEAFARWAFMHNCEWIMSIEHNTVKHITDRKLRPTRHVDALLSEFRVVGYSALDLVNTVVVSLVAGAALGAGTFSWCIGSLAFSLALFCVQLCICVALRPHITWFYFVHSVVTQALAILSVSLALAAAITKSQGPNEFDGIDALSTASTVINLLAVGTLGVRTIIDVRSLVIALIRIVQRLRSDKAAGAPPTLLAGDFACTLLLDEDIVLAELDHVDPVRTHQLGFHEDVPIYEDQDFGNEYGVVIPTDAEDEPDGAFWDDEGNYRQQYLSGGEATASLIRDVVLDRT